MFASFFGESSSPLFGIYHAPTGARRDTGVVICPPIAHEYVRSHRALRQLAVRLNQRGYPVLRFDPYGEGDSSGAAGAGDMERWRADLELACDELVCLGGVGRIVVVGLRLGAAIAATASVDAAGLVLWDPIVSGQALLRELDAMDREMVRDPMRYRSPRQPAAGQRLGYAWPERLRASVGAVDLASQRWWPAPKVALVSGDTAHASGLRAALGEALVREGAVLGEPAAWTKLAHIEDVVALGGAATALLDAVDEVAA